MIETDQIVQRGRPRGFDAQQGVAIAADLFHARGYDLVGVAELTRALGVSPPSFYAAYGSKRALLERALTAYRAGPGAFIDEVVDGDASPIPMAEALLARAAAAYAEDAERPGCLIFEATRNAVDPEAVALTAAARSEIRDRLAARLAEARPAQAPALADYLMVVLAGLSSAARDGTSPEALAGSAAIAALGIRGALGG